MKILITGGTGFIGRNLREQLQDRYSVSAPSSQELNLLDEQKVRDYLRDNLFDIIIHSATWDATRNSKKDRTKILPHNLRMFFNIARGDRFYGRMLLLSSGELYDRTHWIPRMSEDYFDSFIPSDDSGFSKYIMARYLLKCSGITELCLFAIFGKYEDWEIRFISNACCKALYDMTITIKQNVFFDYLFIDDLIGIIDWFITHEAGEKRYNVCTGKTYDLLTLARKVRTIAGKNVDITLGTEGLGREYSGNNSRLLRDMGNYTFSDMDQSIEKVYAWYQENKGKIDRNRLLFDK